MKLPGPDHPIAIAPSRERVRVMLNGRAVADSRRALVLQEAAYKPVFYIPREDADMTLFELTAHGTHCPYKGDASYWSLRTEGSATVPDIAWSYEKPYDEVRRIAGYRSFLGDAVTVDVADPG